MKNQITYILIGISILIIIILSVFFFEKADSKQVILTSIYNTEDILKKNNHENNVSVVVKTKLKDIKSQTNKIDYTYSKSDNKYMIDIKQYTNGTLLNTTKNYFEYNKGKYTFYYNLNNKWENIEIDNINKKQKFKINYLKLPKLIKGYNYIGKAKVNGKKLNKYSVSIKEYNAYNFIYSNSIMDSKNTNKDTKLYLYIDKKNNLIYKIDFDINNIKSKNVNFEYNVSINNSKIDKKIKIDIPKE